MTFTEKYLNPNVFNEKITFEEYCTKIPILYFKKEVPDDVLKNFEVVEKLMAFSYFEYRFIDEAYAKAIHTFEMAMKIRLKDFNNNSKVLSFKALVAKLWSLNLFDTTQDILNHVRRIRNHYAHPERHSFGGVSVWNGVEFISRLINEMYEDINLRLERNKLFKQFKELQIANLDESLVLKVEDIKLIIFKLDLLFVNNKLNPPIYLLACIPLFDLSSQNENVAKVPDVLKIKMKNLVFEKNILTAEDFYRNRIFQFYSIKECKDSWPEFREWKQEYDKKKNKFQYETGIHFRIPEILIPEIQEFQKI